MSKILQFVHALWLRFLAIFLGKPSVPAVVDDPVADLRLQAIESLIGTGYNGILRIGWKLPRAKHPTADDPVVDDRLAMIEANLRGPASPWRHRAGPPDFVEEQEIRAAYDASCTYFREWKTPATAKDPRLELRLAKVETILRHPPKPRPQKRTTCTVDVTSYGLRDTETTVGPNPLLDPRWLAALTSRQLYVRNNVDMAVALTFAGRYRSVNIPKTRHPFCLSDKVTADAIKTSPSLHTAILRGQLTLLDPEAAEKELTDLTEQRDTAYRSLPAQ